MGLICVSLSWTRYGCYTKPGGVLPRQRSQTVIGMLNSSVDELALVSEITDSEEIDDDISLAQL